MSYVANTDIEQRISSSLYMRLIDDTRASSANENRVTEARQSAEAEINSYLGKRYRIPVDPAGDAELTALLKRLTLDLTEYRLHARRPPVPMDVQRKQASAVRWLEAVARGAVVLPSVAVLASNATTGVEGVVQGPSRTMTRHKLGDI